MKLVDQI